VITAVDTNVLIDSLSDDPEFGDGSRVALGLALSEGPVVISEVVFAELAGELSEGDELKRYLARTGVRLVPSIDTTLQQAGNAWVRYARGRPAGVACRACGTLNRVTCTNCRIGLRVRQHLVADFLIGAHALEHADRLLTRDRGYYATYFPTLTIVDPSR
jgi:predicted nucleic acid-binding protein